MVSPSQGFCLMTQFSYDHKDPLLISKVSQIINHVVTLCREKELNARGEQALSVEMVGKPSKGRGP